LSSVVVAVPVYRQRPTPEEILSLRHLRRYLDAHPIRLFAPEGLDVSAYSFPVIRFPRSYFISADAYSGLLLSPDFYRIFERYDYLLIYQLDCLVFSSGLDAWCERGFDYLGAPWLRRVDKPEEGFSRVGNGGLSLRRVASHLEVLTTDRRPRFNHYLQAARNPRLPDLQPLSRLSRRIKELQVLRQARRGSRWYTRHYSLNEDRFWSDRARLFVPSFRVASPSEALPFSFEQAPEFCFELNGNQLPFGCHGWARYGREFWRPHLATGS
jgi:hypothetical protein